MRYIQGENGVHTTLYQTMKNINSYIHIYTLETTEENQFLQYKILLLVGKQLTH